MTEEEGYVPQLISCGPIEARSPRSAVWPGTAVPQLISCGPIEAFAVAGVVPSPLSRSAADQLRPH
mgnify:CR=1 FL=1